MTSNPWHGEKAVSSHGVDTDKVADKSKESAHKTGDQPGGHGDKDAFDMLAKNRPLRIG